jgi:hypothetical protein
MKYRRRGGRCEFSTSDHNTLVQRRIQNNLLPENTSWGKRKSKTIVDDRGWEAV